MKNFLLKLLLPKWVIETTEMFNTPLTEDEKKNFKPENNSSNDWVTQSACTVI